MKKANSVMMFVQCFLRAAFAGAARRVPIEPKKICIIQRAKLGDMVCTTPVFNAIKKQYPKAEVWVVGDALNKQLLGHHPSVDGYIVWDRSNPSIAKELRDEQFDALCITTPNFDALASAYLAGMPCIVAPVIAGGFSPHETRLYKLLRTLAITRPHTMGQYAPREYLRLLEPLGIFTGDTTKTLAYSKEAGEKMSAFMQKNKNGKKLAIGIAPGAGNKVKAWPPERFAAVADYIVEHYDVVVLVFGGPRDSEEIEHMMRAVHHKDKIYNTLNSFSIDELKAVIQQLDLFISADTGPIYIAEAFDVSTIDIVGPIDEREQPPIGPKHKVIVPQRTAPQLFVMNASVYDAAEARRQAEATTVAAVTAVVEKEISSILAQ